LLLLAIVAAEDLYSILGVPRSSSVPEIKQAFRLASRTKHPDKGGDPAVWAKYSHAYEVLTSEEKRQVYDQQGEEGLKRMENGQQGGGDPFGSFFDMFGGGGQRQQGGMAQGPNLEFPIVVTLKDLYLGKELRAAHRKQKLCSHCRGTGAEKPDDVKVCATCKGKGVVIQMQRLGPGFVTQTQQTCNVCGGRGKTVTSTCHRCGGKKVEVGEDILTIHIERGMRAGQKIKFPMTGDQAPDVHAGDVSFVVVEAPHPVFRRDGDDLHMTLSVSLLEALTGFSKTVTHLDGRIVTVARSDTTIPGQVKQTRKERVLNVCSQKTKR
jgi:DnaJ-related protein SCJ1